MVYQLADINLRTVADPKAFMEECDVRYHKLVNEAAERIARNRSKSPIVLLSGPSGSSKTTTAKFIGEYLTHFGVRTPIISLDDYY